MYIYIYNDSLTQLCMSLYLNIDIRFAIAYSMNSKNSASTCALTTHSQITAFDMLVCNT